MEGVWCVSNYVSLYAQPINNGSDSAGPVMGQLGEKCLGNALNMTWLDWTKPTAANVQGKSCRSIDMISISVICSIKR